MSAAFETLRPGAKVQVRVRRDLVSVKTGLPGEIWALSDYGSIGITPQDDGTLLVARSGSTTAAGVGSIASQGSIGRISTGDGGVSAAPQSDPDFEYTLYAPTGTTIEFLDKDHAVVETDVVR